MGNALSPICSKSYIQGRPHVYFTTDCSVTNLNITKENSKYNISPNPSENIINIEIENPDNATMEIYNVSGKLVFCKAVNSEVERIDISDFSIGIYIVKIMQDKTVNVGTMVVN